MAAGWAVQDNNAVTSTAGPVAVGEGVTNAGPPGYVPFGSGQAVGLIEAGPPLSGVDWQTVKFE